MESVGIKSLLPHSAEAATLRRLRLATLRSFARLAVKASRVQAISILFASTLLWCGLFFLFLEGFLFVQKGLVHTGLRTQLIHAIFNVFFLALTMMLFFSSLIITYGSMYRGEEVAFLLSQPLRASRIAVFKFQETLFFSCWGFVLLGSPMLLAYGLVSGSPLYYYLLLLPFVVSFVFIPAAAGAIVCLLIVRILPRLRVYAMLIVLTVAVVATVGVGWRVLAYENKDLMTANWFHDVLARLEFSEQRLLPSWWLSTGILEAAHPVTTADGPPSWLESLLFLSVLVSNALLLQSILGWVASATLRRGYSSLVGMSRTKRRATSSVIDSCVLVALAPFSRELRQFVVKDLKLFRRDPAQWSQFSIFFGLLAFYFFNVRRLDYSGSMAKWILVMSFMNLAVVGLILSTFTTRFIFPMISLEGRRFWVLGTAPIDRNSVLWGKFLFACAGALPVCALLVLLSDVTLQVAERVPWIVGVHQLTCLTLCIGLSSLAVGLGARFPNLREPSPSKIASGVGGTINLVLSSLYIIAVVLATAVPCVFYREGGPRPQETWWSGGVIGLGTPGSVMVGIALTVLLGVLATVIPLHTGLRAFRRLEF